MISNFTHHYQARHAYSSGSTYVRVHIESALVFCTAFFLSSVLYVLYSIIYIVYVDRPCFLFFPCLWILSLKCLISMLRYLSADIYYATYIKFYMLIVDIQVTLDVLR